MPKLKTKSSVKKRFKITATGKVLRGYAFKRHNLRKRPTSMLRKARGMTLLAESTARLIRRLMPYS